MSTEKETTTDTTTKEKTAEETAAEVKAAEQEVKDAKLAELEAENARLKADKEKNTTTKTAPIAYSISSFSEQEWADAETSTGLDRKAILFNLNQRLQLENSVKKEMNDSVEVLRTRVAMREEKDAMAADDPLYPKYRKEVDKFLSDVPTEMLKTEEGRSKWIKKAFAYAKSTVKLPDSRRSADNMDTKETSGKTKEKDEGGFSVEEKEVLASHGKTTEDYNKIKHPFLKDGIMIKDRPEAPKFGGK